MLRNPISESVERLFRYFFENELITAVNFKDKNMDGTILLLKSVRIRKLFVA